MLLWGPIRRLLFGVRTAAGDRERSIMRLNPCDCIVAALLLRAGSELPADRAIQPCPRRPYFRILDAGSFKNYERAHLAALAKTLSPKLAHLLPPELVRKVVEFYLHAGFYPSRRRKPPRPRRPPRGRKIDTMWLRGRRERFPTTPSARPWRSSRSRPTTWAAPARPPRRPTPLDLRDHQQARDDRRAEHEVPESAPPLERP